MKLGQDWQLVLGKRDLMMPRLWKEMEEPVCQQRRYGEVESSGARCSSGHRMALDKVSGVR